MIICIFTHTLLLGELLPSQQGPPSLQDAPLPELVISVGSETLDRKTSFRGRRGRGFAMHLTDARMNAAVDSNTVLVSEGGQRRL